MISDFLTEIYQDLLFVFVPLFVRFCLHKSVYYFTRACLCFFFTQNTIIQSLYIPGGKEGALGAASFVFKFFTGNTGGAGGGGGVSPLLSIITRPSL